MPKKDQGAVEIHGIRTHEPEMNRATMGTPSSRNKSYSREGWGSSSLFFSNFTTE